MVASVAADAAVRGRPPHVPERLVTDFDLYDVPIIDDDLAASWVKVKKEAPGDVFWSDRHQGYWTVLNGRDIEKVYTTPAIFSSQDIFIPPNGSREHVLIPLEMDPPESLKYRKVVQGAMMPTAIADLEAKARTETIALIDGFLARGECDFVSEFAGILPIIVFLALVDLPPGDRHYLVPLAEMSTRPDSPEQRLEGHLALRQYLLENLERRRKDPGPDLLSRMALAEVDGKLVTLDEAQRFAATVMIGGLDTVTNLLGFTALHLARHPEHRRRLIDAPELTIAAADEYIRRYGPVSVARRVVQDVELSGVAMKAGDMVLAPTWMYAADDTLFDNPLDVDFGRKNVRNLTFGGGAHVCLGMHLAKRELRVFLDEWLKRIPDFQVKPGASVPMATGIVSGLLSLPLVW